MARQLAQGCPVCPAALRKKACLFASKQRHNVDFSVLAQERTTSGSQTEHAKLGSYHHARKGRLLVNTGGKIPIIVCKWPIAQTMVRTAPSVLRLALVANQPPGRTPQTIAIGGHKVIAQRRHPECHPEYGLPVGPHKAAPVRKLSNDCAGCRDSPPQSSPPDPWKFTASAPPPKLPRWDSTGSACTENEADNGHSAPQVTARTIQCGMA
jgi:hypothetical protein